MIRLITKRFGTGDKMRWEEKEKHYPDYGEVRKIKKFLFWPQKLIKSSTKNGVEDCRSFEWRWLETATIVQKFCRYVGWWDDRWDDFEK
jgi:hypothetical protein